MASNEPTLLGIPLELMNEILELSLIRPAGDNIYITGKGHERHALLRTCKQIRSEALKIFYYKNNFVLSNYGSFLVSLFKFLHEVRALNLKPHLKPDLISLDTIILKHCDWPQTLDLFQDIHAGYLYNLLVPPAYKLRDRNVKAAVGYFTLASEKWAERWAKVRGLIREQMDVEMEAIKEYYGKRTAKGNN